MARPSLEPPSALNRTIWPVVLAILHGLSFFAGFCVAIPISFSGVSIVNFTNTIRLFTQIIQYHCYFLPFYHPRPKDGEGTVFTGVILSRGGKYPSPVTVSAQSPVLGPAW